jgi:hypothetical protein
MLLDTTSSQNSLTCGSNTFSDQMNSRRTSTKSDHELLKGSKMEE